MIQLNFPPSVLRAAQVAGRIFHSIKRALLLTEALLAVTAGTAVAIASATVLRLSDIGLTRLMAPVFAPAAPPVEGIRTVLLIVIFGGLIWASGGCRKTREWFHPADQQWRR
jgi:hypothetical protein